MPRSLRRFLLLLITCSIGAGAIATGLYLLPVERSSNDTIQIEDGARVDEIATLLREKGCIINPHLFRLAIRIRGVANRVKSGTYRFPRSVSMHELISIITDGRGRELNTITIREGMTARQIASLLRREAGIDSTAFMVSTVDRSFLRFLGIDAPSLEGYLMPDTYAKPTKRTGRAFITMMIKNYRARIAPLAVEMKRSRKTEREVLTLASLVEGETPLASERRRIAGVYANRLREGMRLQADPTIQYVIDDGPRRLLFRDLRIESPYNTYRHAGLPPTPINNPGIDAIRAALDPEVHSYFYFVATGDGGHTFSRTAREHESAVAIYRKRRAEQGH